MRAPGKDVLPDPVVAPPVALVALVGHGDGLDARDALRREQPVAGAEEDGKLPVADGLEHLDGGDVAEAPLERAVVLQADVHPVRQPGRLDALARQRGLLLGQGHARHPRSPLAGRVQREPAPPAADLQHMGAGPQAELLADAAVLGLLRLPQRHLGVLEERARVGPRRVEEQLVEVVPQVVVVLDVAPGAREVGAGRQPRAMPQGPGEDPPRPAGAGQLGRDRQDLEQPHQVVRAPVAGGVRLAERQAPPRGQPAPQVA